MLKWPMGLEFTLVQMKRTINGSSGEEMTKSMIAMAKQPS
jgi:hypothetical protein